MSVNAEIGLDVAELWAAHADAVRAYFRKRVTNEAIADDLASEVWLRVVRAAPRYQDRGAPPLAWIYQIARHAVIDHVRRKHVTEIELVESIARAVVDAGSDRHAAQLDVRAALALLPAPERTVLEQWHLGGHQAHEVGARIGRSKSSIWRAAHRGLKALRPLVEVSA